MPRDIAKPRWICEICGTCYDENKDAAQRCEDAGPPEVLPPGELLLCHTQHPRGWQLEPLTPAPRIETTAKYGGPPGHLACYQLAGVLYDRRPRPVRADGIWPHAPGVVQVYHRNGYSGFGSPGAGHGQHVKAAGWAAALAGLPAPAGGDYDYDRVPASVRPVTPAVRAVLDLLEADVEPLTGSSHYYGRIDALTAAAAAATSRRDGLRAGMYNPARLTWWLAGQDRDTLTCAAAAAQAAWLAGGDVTAPRPRLRSRAWRSGARLTRSKLRKHERAAVTAAGVEWPDRASAGEYLNLLIRDTLETPMTSTTTVAGSPLWSTVPDRIAVTSKKGGVGKTTTAAALAVALAAAGRSVWLADLNLPNPGLHITFGLGPPGTDPAAGLIRGTTIPVPGPGRLRVFSHAQMFPPGRPQDAVLDISQAAEWVTFLAGVLDIAGTDVIIFDMPPGWDAAHKIIFDRNRTALTGVVHVTTGHPLALQSATFPGMDGIPAARRYLLENLSRASGPLVGGWGCADPRCGDSTWEHECTPEERTAEIRLHGTSHAAVAGLAAASRLTYAGSLPWEPDPLLLAGCPEMTALAAAITATETEPA